MADLSAEQLETFLNDKHPVATALKTVFQKEDIIEIRAFNQAGEKYTGRYKYSNQIVRVIEALDEEGFDVYYVLNPVGEAMGLRDLDRGGQCTEEAGVPWRRWFLLDFDSIREHKIATWEQFLAAHTQAVAAKQWLEGMGFTRVVLASSGNGCHLLVLCDLPNDAKSKTLIRHVQRVVADEYSNEAVEVECFPDANRLVRSYGTINKKGVETEELKYNLSAIL